jgi:hypothetical protein
VPQRVQSPSPDANGNYSLTGTIAIQGSPCFSKGTLQPTSLISGYLGHEVYKMDDGSTLDIPIEVEYALDGAGINQLCVSSAVISGRERRGQTLNTFGIARLNTY